MAQARLPYKESLQFGLDFFKKNVGFFIVFLIVAGLIYIIPDAISDAITDSAPLIAMAVGLIAWVIQRIIDLGFIKVGLKACDNVRGEMSDLVSSGAMILNYIGATLLYVLMVFIGLLLLIVPGIIVGIRFQFYGYLIVEKSMGPIEALKESFELTRGVGFELFIFGILVVAVNILGLLLLVVGLFASVSVTIVAYAYVYRYLIKQSTGGGDVLESANS